MNGLDPSKKTKDPCSEVRFDQDQINVSQLKALVSCLNQKQQITPVESWVRNLSDLELEKALVPVNSLLRKEPTLLYFLRETYQSEKKNGKFNEFLNGLFLKLDEKKSDQLVNTLKDHESWLTSWMDGNKIQFSFSEFLELAQFKPFQRLYREHYHTGNLEILIRSLKNYQNSEDSLDIKSIFELFSDFQKNSISDPESAGNFSRWINWFLSEKKFKTISIAAKKIESSPIQCFQGGKEIIRPLEPFIREIASLGSEQLKDYFLKTLPSLILSAQNYCEISGDILEAVRLFQNAAIQPGFSEFMNSLQPLIKKETFKKIILSDSFVELAESFSTLNSTHLFQDIIPLILWLESKPLIKGNVPELLDSVLDEFESDELIFLAKLLPEDKVFFEVLSEFLKNLSVIKIQSLGPISLTPFTHSSFASVIDLAKQMNSDRRLVPLVDELLDLFKSLIDRGKPKNWKKIPPIRKTLSRFGSWELENLTSSDWKLLDEPCTRVDLSFNPFKDYLVLEPPSYWREWDKLSACFGLNRSFRSVKDLMEYSFFEAKDSSFFKKVIRVQDSLVNLVFQFPSKDVLNSLDSLVQLDKDDRLNLFKLSESVSGILRIGGSEFKSASEIRLLLSRHFSNSNFFKTIIDLSRKNPETENHLRENLTQVVLQKLPDLFQEFCPDPDAGTGSCKIESDQLKLYRESKTLLAQTMVEEYLRSGQNWIHPKESNSWSIHASQPKTVGELNYHLNPLFKQFKNRPKAVQGVFDFLKRNRGSRLTLQDFLIQKSLSFSVIPYLYQNGDYPETSREYKDQIRLKIINEIDRIELLAINADFMPFGLMKNFGMNFIREIALAWGDLPISERPPYSNSTTLAEAKESILRQYTKYNLEFIQKWGNCENSNRTRLASWFHRNICKGELGDIRSRMFNLSQTLSVIEDPETLVLLRDLFYSFYSSNDPDRFDVFTNGLKLNSICMSPGSDDPSVNSQCRVDLLETIPQIARTGVLHQASLSIAETGGKTIQSLIKVLDHASDSSISKELIQFVSQKEGLDFLLQLIDLGLNLDENALSGLASVSRNLGNLSDQGWISFLIQLTKKHPQLIRDYKPLIQKILSKLDLPNDLSAESLQYLSRISSELSSSGLANEFSRILLKNSSLQKEWIQILEFDLSRKISPDWLSLLSRNENERARQELAAFVRNKDFDDFCDVLSDSQWVEKAYKILEESHQNSGVHQLIHHARLFLH